MIKRGLLLITILFLIGCTVEETAQPTTIVCNVPYIRHADSCCLDQNNNKICDSDEAIKTPEKPSAPSTPVITPTEPTEGIKIRTIEKCELNNDLECVNAIVNDTGIELELKNNLNAKINFHRIELAGICTQPFELFIQPKETTKLLMKCVIGKDVSKIYYNVFYDAYGIKQNRIENGIITIK